MDWTGNHKTLAITLGASNHSDKEREKNDYYATEPKATELLLEREMFHTKVWECACVDSTTEYFNGKEWVYISQYKDGDSVLCFDGVDMTASMETPRKYYKIPYDGVFYHYHGRDLNMKLTPDHRMVYLHRRNKSIQVDTAENVFTRYKKDSNGFRGKVPTCFTFRPEDTIDDIDEWLLRLAIACNADARQRSKNSYQIRVSKDRKNERIKYLLKKAKIKYSYTFYDGRHSYQFVSPLGCKRFPKEWVNLSDRLKRIFIDEVTKWDGCEREDGSLSYFSNKKDDVDLVQFIAHSVGVQAIIDIDYRIGDENRDVSYRLRFKNQTNHALTKKPNNNLSIELSSDGYKYCFSVSTGMLVLRRNGKIFITGNCGEGHISEVLKKHGYDVYSTDLIDRGYGDGVYDFLTHDGVWHGDIITNPPYKYALEFIQNALDSIEEGHKVAMFLRLQFLEGKKRHKFFKENPPKCVYVASSRLHCAINGDFENTKGNAVCFAWFVWEKGYKGKPEIEWLP